LPLLTTGWFFHENCRFFDVSDVTGTGHSLILIVSLKDRTGSSLILKFFKAPEQSVTERIKYPLVISLELK
jgi:hypothetical protein